MVKGKCSEMTKLHELERDIDRMKKKKKPNVIVLWASISYSKIIQAIQLRACLELPFRAFVSTRCRSSIVFLAIDFKLFLFFSL